MFEGLGLGARKMATAKFIKILAGTILACTVLVWQHALVLESYASIFEKDNATPGADAIVVLSSPHFTRLSRAFELGNDGYAPRILVTTTPVRDNIILGLKYPTKLEWVNAVASHMKYPQPVTLLPALGDGARSTFDEAYDARKWAIDNGYKRIILVTNVFHSRRAHYAFEKVFKGSGVDVEVAAARDLEFSAENWWLIDKGLASYLTEPLKFAAYIVFEYSPSFVENL